MTELVEYSKEIAGQCFILMKNKCKKRHPLVFEEQYCFLSHKTENDGRDQHGRNHIHHTNIGYIQHV